MKTALSPILALLLLFAACNEPKMRLRVPDNNAGTTTSQETAVTADTLKVKSTAKKDTSILAAKD